MNSEAGSADPLEEPLAEAARLFDEGDAAAAFELLSELESRHPDHPTLLCMLGVTAGETEAGGMAYDYFRRCLATQPDDPEVLAMLGAALARYDDPDAEGVLRLAALTAPAVASARLRYGSYLAREGIADLALAELEAARELEPENAEIRRELGVAHLLAGTDALAVDSLRDAVSLSPDEAETRFLLGLALLRAGEPAEGAEELHGAALALTDDGDVQLVAALACASQEWDGEAWNALARAEGASVSADAALVREAEEAIEAGAEPARELLVTQIAPSILRMRLLDRD